MEYQAVLQKYRKHLIGAFCLLVTISALVILLLSKGEKEEKEEILLPGDSSQIVETEALSKEIYVDIKGAVKKPGMYEGAANMRVWDAVMLAGGVGDEADTKQVNFSKRITDQMVIYVPTIGEEVTEQSITETSDENQNKELDKINLNQANESELQELPGIGQKKAQEIIRYREENGGFKSIEELKNISGFGEKTFERLKETISV